MKTKEQIEQEIAEQVYEVMMGQQFCDFYTNDSDRSLASHIEGRDNCPSKNDVLKTIKRIFSRVVDKAIRLVEEENNVNQKPNDM